MAEPHTGIGAAISIEGLKTKIRDIFETCNTTTAAPLYLSNGLSRQVTDVYMVNPERIPIDAQVFPCLTVFTDGKNIEPVGISKNQMSSHRKAEINLYVAGIVWNDTFASVDKDPADNDLEKLMENAELVLRAYPTLEGTVDWQFPEGVNYHTVAYDEDNHMRAGLMSLKCRINY